MSRENVEVVQRIIEANCSHDIASSIEICVALTDPEFRHASVVSTLGADTYVGHQGIARYFDDLAASWESWSCDVVELRDLGSDTVFSIALFRAVGKGSGAAVEARLGGVWVLSDGRLLEARLYPTPDEALEAVGLRD